MDLNQFLENLLSDTKGLVDELERSNRIAASTNAKLDEINTFLEGIK